MALDQIKLCMECRWRRSMRDEGDKTPCALAPDTTLRQAREQCGGLQWSQRHPTYAEQLSL